MASYRRCKLTALLCDIKDEELTKSFSVIFLFISITLFSQTTDNNKHLSLLGKCSESDWVEGKCYEQIEKAADHKYFHREGSQLHIILSNQKEVVLTNVAYDGETNFGEIRVFNYFSFLEAINYHLIHVSLFEGIYYLLINNKNGTTYTLDDMPVFSPNNTKFVTACAAIVHSSNCIYFWKLNDENCIMIFTYPLGTLDRTYYNDVRWLNDYELEIKYDSDKLTNKLKFEYLNNVILFRKE